MSDEGKARRRLAGTHEKVPIWYIAVVLFISATLMGAVAFGMVVRSERKWCRLLIILEQPSSPPTTERGVKIATEISNLRRDFGC